MDFLLVISELFSLGGTDEALRANIDWKWVFLLERDQFGPQFHLKVILSQQPLFLSEN